MSRASLHASLPPSFRSCKKRERVGCPYLAREPFPPAKKGKGWAAFIWQGSLSRLQEKGKGGLPLSGRGSLAFPACKKREGVGCLYQAGEPFPPARKGKGWAAFIWEGSLAFPACKKRERVGCLNLGGGAFPASFVVPVPV